MGYCGEPLIQSIKANSNKTGLDTICLSCHNGYQMGDRNAPTIIAYVSLACNYTGS